MKISTIIRWILNIVLIYFVFKENNGWATRLWIILISLSVEGLGLINEEKEELENL